MAVKNYYDILNVKQTATSDEIKKAFRKLSIKFHPDKNDGDEFLSEMFKNINEANEILSNPQKRKAFDSTLDNNTSHNYSSNSYEKPKENNSYNEENELKKKVRNLVTNGQAYLDQQKVVTNRRRLYSEAVNAPKQKYISFLSIIILGIVTLLIWIMFKPKPSNNNTTQDTTQNISDTPTTYGVWTTKEMAEIYKEPDIESEILGHAQRYQSFDALEETKYFIKISYERGSATETGYLRKKQLDKK